MQGSPVKLGGVGGGGEARGGEQFCKVPGRLQFSQVNRRRRSVRGDDLGTTRASPARKGSCLGARSGVGQCLSSLGRLRASPAHSPRICRASAAQPGGRSPAAPALPPLGQRGPAPPGTARAGHPGGCGGGQGSLSPVRVRGRAAPCPSATAAPPARGGVVVVRCTPARLQGGWVEGVGTDQLRGPEKKKKKSNLQIKNSDGDQGRLRRAGSSACACLPGVWGSSVGYVLPPPHGPGEMGCHRWGAGGGRAGGGAPRAAPIRSTGNRGGGRGGG